MDKQESTIIYKKNQAVLKEIELKVPQRLRDNLMKKVTNTEQEETAKKLLERNDLVPELRDKIQKDLDAGVYRFEEEVEDLEIIKELDEYYSKEVKAAIADGRLSSPDEDPFFQKIVAKIDSLNAKQ
jgi:hypothetical protein